MELHPLASGGFVLPAGLFHELDVLGLHGDIPVPAVVADYPGEEEVHPVLHLLQLLALLRLQKAGDVETAGMIRNVEGKNVAAAPDLLYLPAEDLPLHRYPSGFGGEIADGHRMARYLFSVENLSGFGPGLLPLVLRLRRSGQQRADVHPGKPVLLRDPFFRGAQHNGSRRFPELHLQTQGGRFPVQVGGADQRGIQPGLEDRIRPEAAGEHLFKG